MKLGKCIRSDFAGLNLYLRKQCRHMWEVFIGTLESAIEIAQFHAYRYSNLYPVSKSISATWKLNKPFILSLDKYASCLYTPRQDMLPHRHWECSPGHSRGLWDNKFQFAHQAPMEFPHPSQGSCCSSVPCFLFQLSPSSYLEKSFFCGSPSARSACAKEFNRIR